MATIRGVGPFSGWRWLRSAINVGSGQPGAVFGAVALFALVGLVPTVVQLVLQFGLGMQQAEIMIAVGVLTLAMMLVYPLFVGGLLRVIDAAERGQPVRATDLFATFGRGRGAARLLGFGWLLLLLCVLVVIAILLPFGATLSQWNIEPALASGDAASLPPMPAGLGLMVALGALATLFFSGTYAIGFGQVALSGRGVFGALGDGLLGSLRNALALLVLGACFIVLILAVTLVFLLVAALVSLVGGLVHQGIAVALVALVYLATMIGTNAVMFGVMYFMWRDVAGQDAAPPSLPDDRVEI